MNFRSDLRKATARMTLDVLKVVGATCTYSNVKTDALTLFCDPGPETRKSGSVLETISEVSTRTFTIPAQANWPIEGGPTISDVITFDCMNYNVDEWTDISGGVGSVWAVTASRTHPTTLGIKGPKGVKKS